MNLRKLGLGVVFLTGAIIGGLALAFLLVVFRPELLVHQAPAHTRATAAPQGTPTLAAASAAVPAGGGGPDAAPANGVVARSFAAAVRRAAPAVVNIYTARVVTERVQPSSFEQLFGEYGPRYQQYVQRALGSGVIVDDGGHIITNNHVIAEATSIKVQLADGRSAEARVVGRDPDTDLALLSIRLAKLPVMALGRSDRLQVGDEVLAIGNPLGLQQTVTHGIVSATDRKELGVATFENFIQTDAAINEGNSGGALIDANGELVGINTAVIAKNMDATGVEGIGFAIPVNLARGVMREILDHGHVVRGWSGIVAEDFTNDQAAQYRLPRGGVVVTQLIVNSPAVNAGLRPGDILLAIDGHAVERAQEALAQLASHKPGGSVRLRLQRGARVLELDCAVLERPSQS
ncbi:MAG TPA: trypsin-like peptidase domain-containing protein [Steroidobacteraceae bacterium]